LLRIDLILRPLPHFTSVMRPVIAHACIIIVLKK